MARYIDADEFFTSFCIFAMGQDKGFINAVECILDDMPTADVEEVRHGRWLPQVVGGLKAWDCSECKTIGSPQWKRCPICEAKMDGGKEE